MPKVDLSQIEENNRTGYPQPYAADVAGRWARRLAPALGLEDFGANLVRLEPGAWSSQRHWHEEEDEVLIMLEGEAVLVEDDSRTLLRPGDVAVWRKGVPNGHHLINESDRDCRFFVVGRAPSGDCHYPDIDLHVDGATNSYVHKDGSSY
jgi:uncharacterized cupin superfamily protein